MKVNRKALESLYTEAVYGPSLDECMAIIVRSVLDYLEDVNNVTANDFENVAQLSYAFKKHIKHIMKIEKLTQSEIIDVATSLLVPYIKDPNAHITPYPITKRMADALDMFIDLEYYELTLRVRCLGEFTAAFDKIKEIEKGSKEAGANLDF